MRKVADTPGALKGPAAAVGSILASAASRGKADGGQQAAAVVEARATEIRKPSLIDYFRFAVVAVYLCLVLCFLVVTRRVQWRFSIRYFLLHRLFRRRRPVDMGNIDHESGYCYIVPVSHLIPSDAESVSFIHVYEDGVPLPAAHAGHDDIREKGGGAFSHWAGRIYFSATDNTDPRTNKRRYTYQEGKA
jgi:hypothetical protein